MYVCIFIIFMWWIFNLHSIRDCQLKVDNSSLPEIHFRTDSRIAPSQWETSLQSYAVSHWLGANLESPCILYLFYQKRLHYRANNVWMTARGNWHAISMLVTSFHSKISWFTQWCASPHLLMPPIKPSDSVKLFCKVKAAVAQMWGRTEK